MYRESKTVQSGGAATLLDFGVDVSSWFRSLGHRETPSREPFESSSSPNMLAASHYWVKRKGGVWRIRCGATSGAFAFGAWVWGVAAACMKKAPTCSWGRPSWP